MTITSCELIKRQTNLDAKEDFAFCRLIGTSGIYRYEYQYKLSYNFYDVGGWILDEMTPEKQNEWRMIYPGADGNDLMESIVWLDGFDESYLKTVEFSYQDENGVWYLIGTKPGIDKERDLFEYHSNAARLCYDQFGNEIYVEDLPPVRQRTIPEYQAIPAPEPRTPYEQILNDGSFINGLFLTYSDYQDTQTYEYVRHSEYITADGQRVLSSFYGDDVIRSGWSVNDDQALVWPGGLLNGGPEIREIQFYDLNGNQRSPSLTVTGYYSFTEIEIPQTWGSSRKHFFVYENGRYGLLPQILSDEEMNYFRYEWGWEHVN